MGTVSHSVSASAIVYSALIVGLAAIIVNYDLVITKPIVPDIPLHVGEVFPEGRYPFYGLDRPEYIDGMPTYQLRNMMEKSWMDGITLTFQSHIWTDSSGMLDLNGEMHPGYQQLQNLCRGSTDNVDKAVCILEEKSGSFNCKFYQEYLFGSIDITKNLHGYPNLSCRNPRNSSGHRDESKFYESTCVLQYVMEIDINPNPWKKGKDLILIDMILQALFTIMIILVYCVLIAFAGPGLVALIIIFADYPDTKKDSSNPNPTNFGGY